MKSKTGEKILNILGKKIEKNLFLWAWSRGENWSNYALIGDQINIQQFLDRLECKISKTQVTQEEHSKCYYYVYGTELLDEVVQRMLRGKDCTDLIRRYSRRRILVLKDFDRISYYQREYIMQTVFKHWRCWTDGGMLFVISKKDIELPRFKKLYF